MDSSSPLTLSRKPTGSAPRPLSTRILLRAERDEILECATVDESDRLKRELFPLAASYDRGYGASPRARQQVQSILEQLEEQDKENDADAARGISGSESTMDMNESSPLRGNWRMIWTTASDVLLLEASPFFSTGAIYQVFDPPVVTNIIDFSPRIQTLFPPTLVPNTLIRAKVQTRASRRTEQPNRIGLVFERVQIQPLQVLGQTLDIFPPLEANLPQLPGSMNTDEGPGYFDVTYLDDELLIIRQNAPGGLFALVKVDSIEA